MLPTSGQVCGTAVLDQTPLIERVPFLQEIKKCAHTKMHKKFARCSCKETSTMIKLIGLPFQTKMFLMTLVINYNFCALYLKSSIKW